MAKKKTTGSAAAAVEKKTSEEKKAEDAQLATDWLKAIASRRDTEADWREKKAPAVIERYRDERGAVDANGKRFNILWANTETLKPAVLAKMPVPDIRRRYATKNAPARTAALILERSVSFYMDRCLDDCMERSLEDYLLPGRASCIVRYKAVTDTVQARVGVPKPEAGPADNAGVDDDELDEQGYPAGTQYDEQGAYRMEAREDVVYHEVYPEYQPWNLFVFGQAKTWKKVPWVALGTLLTKGEIKAQYKHLTEQDLDSIDFSYSMRDTPKDNGREQGTFALFWDVWDKLHRTFIVVAEGLQKTVLVQQDPLKLEEFYPFPEPLYSLRTNQNWTPVPEYVLYQDQAMQLDEAMERLDALTRALKVRGVYDASFDNAEAKTTLGNLLKAPDLTLIPIQDFRTLVEKGGLKAIIDTLPIEEIARCIKELRDRVAELKQIIYEVTGISDIVRGATKATETLGAQQLKAQYSGLRISKRQDRIQRYGQEIFVIAAEIIAEHVDPKTLAIIAGIQVVEDAVYEQKRKEKALEAGMVSVTEFQTAIQILKSDKLRGFKIEVEADSTIPADKEGEQKLRVDFLTMVGAYLNNVMPAVEKGLVPPAVAREGLLFGVRSFKIGSEFEEVLEQLGEQQDDGAVRESLAKIQQQAQMLLEENGKLKEDNQKLQSNQAVKFEAAKADAAIAERESSHKMVLEEREQQHKMALETQAAEHKKAMDQQAMQHEQGRATMMMEHENKLKETSARADESKQRTKEQQVKSKAAETDATTQKGIATLQQGQQQIVELLQQLLQQMSAPKKPSRRTGRARLPSGGVMEFEIGDAQAN